MINIVYTIDKLFSEKIFCKYSCVKKVDIVDDSETFTIILTVDNAVYIAEKLADMDVKTYIPTVLQYLRSIRPEKPEIEIITREV